MTEDRPYLIDTFIFELLVFAARILETSLWSMEPTNG
jgi:hypothetical protein